MKRRRHSPEEIIRKLREADAQLANGTTVAEVSKTLGISENTFHRWRAQYGGMKAGQAKRLKALEKESGRRDVGNEQSRETSSPLQFGREVPLNAYEPIARDQNAWRQGIIGERGSKR